MLEEQVVVEPTAWGSLHQDFVSFAVVYTHPLESFLDLPPAFFQGWLGVGWLRKRLFSLSNQPTFGLF